MIDCPRNGHGKGSAGLFRGVILPAGAHRVEMRYSPQSLPWGLGLMGMALLVVMRILTTNLHEFPRMKKAGS